MIDWITAIINVDHSMDDLSSGMVYSVNENGEIEWQSRKKVFSEGSYSSKVLVRSHGDQIYYDENGLKRCKQLYIDGNPAKFLNGHNVTGSNNLLSLNYAFIMKVLAGVNIIPSFSEQSDIFHGEYFLNRVDCTDYLEFKDSAEVSLVLNRLAETGTYAGRGNATTSNGTVYFGKSSTWYAIKFYNKFQELIKHKIPNKIANSEYLKEFVKNKIRCELVLRKRELNKLYLRIARNWTDDTVADMLKKYINDEKIHINSINEFSDNELLEMPRSLRSTYSIWKTGIDTSTVMSKATWYRHRKQLLNYGIDISVKPHTDTNIIKFKKTVEVDFTFKNLSVA